MNAMQHSQQLDYRGGQPPMRRTGRIVGGIILIVVGLPVASYYSIGALFVAGAVRQQDPSVTWRHVALCLLWVMGGITMVVTGIVLIARRRKAMAPTTPP